MNDTGQDFPDMLTLSKSFEFCASHRLFRSEWSDEQNWARFGKCSNPYGHGHNYRLEVIVRGTPDPDTGMVIDAALLDDIVQKRVIRDVDHRNLDIEVEWMKGKRSTVELFAQAIFERIAPEIHHTHPNAQLHCVRLYETSRIFAECWGV